MLQETMYRSLQPAVQAVQIFDGSIDERFRQMFIFHPAPHIILHFFQRHSGLGKLSVLVTIVAILAGPAPLCFGAMEAGIVDRHPAALANIIGFHFFDKSITPQQRKY